MNKDWKLEEVNGICSIKFIKTGEFSSDEQAAQYVRNKALYSKDKQCIDAWQKVAQTNQNQVIRAATGLNIDRR